MPMLKASVKVVGSNGQISLGKEYAGKQILIERPEPGVWTIRTAKVIPDNELWLHRPQSAQDLKLALKWSLSHPPRESDADAVIAKLGNESKSKYKSR